MTDASTRLRPRKRSRPSKTAEELLKSAKRLWTEGGDLARVEELLRESIDGAVAADEFHNDHTDKESIRAEAADTLALLCAQSNDANKRDEATRLMQSENYIARLSSEVLWYSSTSNNSNNNSNKTSSNSNDSTITQEDLFCLPLRVIDQALPQACLLSLQQSFCSENCDYWTAHNYSVYPPSPYFSYVVPLPRSSDRGRMTLAGPLGELIDTVRRHAEANFDGVEVARFAEVWAHRRPHCSGHQLHFDSDNEGIGGAASIRNPLVSAVCYLTEEGLGGPTLVTDQCLGDRGLAQNGWLAFPKLNRLVLFDGQVLHGVIPGRGYPTVKSSSSDHHKKRVTVMVALWDDIRIRHGDVPGAARPMPLTSATAHTNTLPNVEGSPPRIPKWAYDLCGDGGGRGEPGRVPSQTVSLNTESAAPAENSLLTAPVYVSNVWTRLNGKPLDDGETPHYNRVFQGF